MSCHHDLYICFRLQDYFVCVCVYSMLTTNPFLRCLLVGWSLSFSSFLQKYSCKQYSLSYVCYLLYLKNGMTGYEISGSHFNSLSYKLCSTDFWYWMLWQNLRPAWYQPLIKDFVQGMRKMFGCPKKSLFIFMTILISFLWHSALSIYKFQFCDIFIILITICFCTEFLLHRFHF